MIDGSGTINPAALNTPGITIPPLHIHTWVSLGLCEATLPAKPFCLIPVIRDSHVITRRITKGVTDAGSSSNLGSVLPPSSSTTNIAPKSSPRGIKRSRSPEPLGDLALGGADDGM